MDLERLYAKLPVPLQNVAATIEGWRIQRGRFNRQFRRFLAEYNARTFAARDEIVAYRDHRIAEFVAQAAASVPHYRDLFARLGVDPRDIRSLADLAALPILRKCEVQEHPERFISNAVDPRETTSIHTSGSTGAGLKFPVLKRASREQWAVWERYRLWHGLDRRTWCLHFGGRSVVPSGQSRPPFWRYNRAGRQTLFSAYHLSLGTAPAYLDEIQRSEAPWIHGYPSFVALVASFAQQLGRRLPMRWVTLGAESVLPRQQDIIHETFGVKPIQHYGMAEGAANISECPRGRLHVDEDFSGVEFLPRDDDTEGGAYDIIGTNFYNPAFALIRYDVGDVAALGDGACDCGRPGRVVERIDGRQEDYIVTSKGARLGRLDHVFKDMVNIREAQLFQHSAGEMTVRVVRGPRYADADERALCAEIRKRVGDDVRFNIDYVDSLPRTSRGKLRFVVSTLKDGSVAWPGG